jgi:hypothetical protein
VCWWRADGSYALAGFDDVGSMSHRGVRSLRVLAALMAVAHAPLGGRRCKCAGGASCAHAQQCCKRVGGPQAARALRCPDASGGFTRCLGCAGEGGAERPWQVRKRPAAPPPAPVAKAKAAAAGPPVGAGVPQVVAPPPLVPPVAPGVSDAAAATGVSPELYAARTAALLRHADAMDRNSAALVAYAQAVGAQRSAGAGSTAATTPRATLPLAATVAAAPSAAVEPAAPADVSCPLVLQPLRTALANALGRPGTVAAEVVLRDAGLTPSSSVSWARLRVSVVAFHPFDAARVRGRLGGMRPRFSHRILYSSWRCVMCADQLRGVPVCKYVSPPKPQSVVADQDLPAAHEPCEACASILCCVAGCPRIVRPDESWVERDVCKSALPYLSDAHARHRCEARGFAVYGCARIRPRGMDMKDRVSPEIVRMCERWSGGQRLRDVVCSFGEQSPATHVGNLARFLLARPSLRVRQCERLLLDAVLLARLVGSDGSAVALVKRGGSGGGGGGAEGQAWDTTEWRRAHAA